MIQKITFIIFSPVIYAFALVWFLIFFALTPIGVPLAYIFLALEGELDGHCNAIGCKRHTWGQILLSPWKDWLWGTLMLTPKIGPMKRLDNWLLK